MVRSRRTLCAAVCYQAWMSQRSDVSKHDVKGAFLNVRAPEGKMIVVSALEQWVRWGLVLAGVTWILKKSSLWPSGVAQTSVRGEG